MLSKQPRFGRGYLDSLNSPSAFRGRGAAVLKYLT
jgi:hypothetical protein